MNKTVETLTEVAESWGWEHTTAEEPEAHWTLVYEDGSEREVVSEGFGFAAEYGRSEVMVLWVKNPESGRWVLLSKTAKRLGKPEEDSARARIAATFGFDPPGTKSWEYRTVRDIQWILAHPEDWWVNNE